MVQCLWSWYGQVFGAAGIFSVNRNFYTSDEKFENLYFLILWFCLHDVTLEADLEPYACDVDMVDSALKTLGLALSKVI